MVSLQHGVEESQRGEAARLYWEAFGGKLDAVLGPDDRAVAFIAASMRTDHCIAALDPKGRLLGIAGYKSPEGGFVGGSAPAMRKVYGWGGALWRSAALWTLSHEIDNDRFLIDGIAVARDARGLGIGSKLVEALCDEGAARGYGSIRLEVIDTNWRAKALYERLGFMDVKTERMGPLRHLFGFSAATTMVRPLQLGR
jgi:ribosomal protein S18 acetylase RimI-like enzyme